MGTISWPQLKKQKLWSRFSGHNFFFKSCGVQTKATTLLMSCGRDFVTPTLRFVIKAHMLWPQVHDHNSRSNVVAIKQWPHVCYKVVATISRPQLLEVRRRASRVVVAILWAQLCFKVVAIRWWPQVLKRVVTGKK